MNQLDEKQDEVREAAGFWYDKLSEEEKRKVFIELVVGNSAGKNYIYQWVKEYQRKLVGN